MKEVREKAGDVGACLEDARSKREWKVEWLMFADDTVLVGDSERKLQRLVKEFGSVCKRRKLAVNVGKSKVMRIGKNREENVLDVQLNDSRMEEVDCYRYLGVDFFQTLLGSLASSSDMPQELNIFSPSSPIDNRI